MLCVQITYSYCSYSPGCNRGFAVISNLRRHFKVHEPKANDSTRMSPQERVMRVYRLATLSQEMNQHSDDTSITSLPYVEQQQQPTTITNSTNSITTTVPTSAPSLPFVSTTSSLPSFSSPTYHDHIPAPIVTKDTPFHAPSLPTCSALIPPTGVLNSDPFSKRL